MAAHGETSGADLEAQGVQVRVAGRILGMRTFGKANFLVLSDGKARVQAYVRQDSVPELDFSVFRLLDFGDWVGVSGRVFRTKTNELTVWASSLTFLAKCFLPLPEKWHGLTDVETRYRQRYLDLAVNPESRRVFETRSRVVSTLRSFLMARGFLEVETPMMQPIAGGALARPFVTHHNALDIPLYMRIAPELYLKRLTVGGIERVFEINRNFRNEGISTQHNPEFTMLEFYWSYADYHDLMALTEELIVDVAATAGGSTTLPFGDHQISYARAVSPAVDAGGGLPGGQPPSGKRRDGADAARGRGRRGPRRDAGDRGERRGRAGAHHGRALRGPVRGRAGAADLRLRFSDRGVPAGEAASRRSRHGRALRAVCRRLRSGQRLQRAERSGGAAAAVRGAARRAGRREMPRRTPWTTTTCAPWSTACRRPGAAASASIAW